MDGDDALEGGGDAGKALLEVGRDDPDASDVLVGCHEEWIGRAKARRCAWTMGWRGGSERIGWGRDEGS